MSSPTPLVQFLGDGSLDVGGSLGLSITNSITPTYVSGPLGGDEQALSLVGSKYVAFTATSSLSISSSFSTGMWVQIPTAVSGEQTYISQESSNGFSTLKWSSSNWGAHLWGSSTYAADATSVITAGQWQHIWITFDGSKIRLYRNATLVATSSTVSGGGFASSSAWRIGAPGPRYGGSSYLNGYVYDFRVYNSVVSAETAQAAVSTPVSVSTAQTNVGVYGESTGSITLTVSGGSGTYTFAWSDGPTTQNRTGLPAGAYTVTVTSGSDTEDANVTITQPAPTMIFVTTPVATRVSWNAVSGATYYKVTRQISGGSQVTVVTDRTTLYALVPDLSPSTMYTIRVYSSTAAAPTTYVLAYTRVLTTPADDIGNVDTSALETTIDGETVVDLRDVSSSSTVASALSTGDRVHVEARGSASSRTITATAVKLGESVSVTRSSATVPTAVFMPFFASGGGSQEATLTLTDSSTVAVTFDEGNTRISISGTTYDVGDIFILDGQKVTVMEV